MQAGSRLRLLCQTKSCYENLKGNGWSRSPNTAGTVIQGAAPAALAHAHAHGTTLSCASLERVYSISCEFAHRWYVRDAKYIKSNSQRNPESSKGVQQQAGGVVYRVAGGMRVHHSKQGRLRLCRQVRGPQANIHMKSLRCGGRPSEVIPEVKIGEGRRAQGQQQGGKCGLKTRGGSSARDVRIKQQRGRDGGGRVLHCSSPRRGQCLPANPRMRTWRAERRRAGHRGMATLTHSALARRLAESAASARHGPAWRPCWATGGSARSRGAARCRAVAPPSSANQAALHRCRVHGGHRCRRGGCRPDVAVGQVCWRAVVLPELCAGGAGQALQRGAGRRRQGGTRAGRPARSGACRGLQTVQRPASRPKCR